MEYIEQDYKYGFYASLYRICNEISTSYKCNKGINTLQEWIYYTKFHISEVSRAVLYARYTLIDSSFQYRPLYPLTYFTIKATNNSFSCLSLSSIHWQLKHFKTITRNFWKSFFILKGLYFHRLLRHPYSWRTYSDSTHQLMNPNNRRNLNTVFWWWGCVQGITEQPLIQGLLKVMGISLPSPTISRSSPFPVKKGTGGRHLTESCIAFIFS